MPEPKTSEAKHKMLLKAIHEELMGTLWIRDREEMDVRIKVTQDADGELGAFVTLTGSFIGLVVFNYEDSDEGPVVKSAWVHAECLGELQEFLKKRLCG